MLTISKSHCDCPKNEIFFFKGLCFKILVLVIFETERDLKQEEMKIKRNLTYGDFL